MIERLTPERERNRTTPVNHLFQLNKTNKNVDHVGHYPDMSTANRQVPIPIPVPTSSTLPADLERAAGGDGE